MRKMMMTMKKKRMKMTKMEDKERENRVGFCCVAYKMSTNFENIKV